MMSATLLLSSAMRPGRRVTLAIVLPVAFVAGGYVLGRDYIRGAAFVVQAAGMQGIARTAAGWERDRVVDTPLTVPWRGGVLPARRYLPEGRKRRAFLLVPGVHASGVDEPRLMGFARDIAAMGHPVVTVGPPDLARYTITPQTTDAIEDAAAWLAADRELAADGRVGMMGISFAGGLSLVAAGRPGVRDKVAAVLSLGGHGDLPRTLKYLCTGLLPDGSRHAPHDYGVVIILLGVADRVVPPDQVAGLREALLSFLEASRLDLIDKAKSAAEFERARALGQKLPEPSRTLKGYVSDREVARLGPMLLPHVTAFGGGPALSPVMAPPPAADVFLLHGADDNVIPAAESVLLGQTLASRQVRVHVLATPLITHAEVDRASDLRDIWGLIAFWARVLDD
jgi:dienelactone hydrolase